jgi:hypothetical protein
MNRSKPTLSALVVTAMALGTAQLSGQEVAEWSISADPVLQVGVVEGPPEYMFSSIRDIRPLADGRIVVADREEATLRVYDERGTFLRAIGSQGEGPGEFRGISGISVRSPDTIQVWDASLARMTVVRADGSVVGTERFDPGQPGGPGGGVIDGFAGVFRDGDVVLSWTIAGPGEGEDVLPDRTVFGRFSPAGSLRHLLGEGEGLHRFRRQPDPFSPFPHAVVVADSVYFTNGVDGRIAVLDPDRGGVVRTLEVPVRPEPAERAWRALREVLREDGRESVLERMPPPQLQHTPALAGMLADGADRIWVKVYDPTSDSVYLDRPPGPGGEWWVLSPEGRHVASVAMPDHVTPVWIEGDRLLAIARGPFDVERAVIHTISR